MALRLLKMKLVFFLPFSSQQVKCNTDKKEHVILNLLEEVWKSGEINFFGKLNNTTNINVVQSEVVPNIITNRINRLWIIIFLAIITFIPYVSTTRPFLHHNMNGNSIPSCFCQYNSNNIIMHSTVAVPIVTMK